MVRADKSYGLRDVLDKHRRPLGQLSSPPLCELGSRPGLASATAEIGAAGAAGLDEM